MAVYCVSRADVDVLAELGNARRVSLVGCPICPNMSCAVNQDEDLPVIKLGLTGFKPVCITNEVSRLADFLAKRGASVDSWLPGFGGLCVLEERGRKKLVKQSRGSEAVVSLSCEVGTKNVERILADKRVVGAMNAKGLLTAAAKRRGRQVRVDRSTVDISRFTFD